MEEVQEISNFGRTKLAENSHFGKSASLNTRNLKKIAILDAQKWPKFAKCYSKEVKFYEINYFGISKLVKSETQKM